MAMTGERLAPPRVELPTKEQVAAIADVAALEAIRDTIADSILKIETDLEYGPRDDEWAGRATAALYFHRAAKRTVTARLRELEGARGHRSDDECSELSRELLTWAAEDDVSEIKSAAEATDKLDWLVTRIHALKADRAEEQGRPIRERDAGWLARVEVVLDRAKAQRAKLSGREALLRRAERVAEADVRDRTRERLFIQACREIFDRNTFLAIWDRVDRMAYASVMPEQSASTAQDAAYEQKQAASAASEHN